MEFKGKTVIVTGAGGGIGRSIAELYASEGAKVVVAEIDRRGGAETVQRITDLGGQALFVETDVSQEESVQKMVATAVDRFGGVEILCNNAAIEIRGIFRDFQTPEWDRVLSVNLRGVYLCSRLVIPHLIQAGGGSVINISSVQALATTGRVAAYAATKGAILSLTRDLAQDLGEFNIRVNAVCPGVIQTPLMDRNMAHIPNREEAVENIRQAIPLKRLGTPEDVAHAVLFLTSSRSSYISGAALVIDGGLISQLPLPR